MSKIQVEKFGGLAGFGGGHLRSRGEVDSDALSADDQREVEALFGSEAQPVASIPDGFRFRISRSTGSKTETVEVPEQMVPPALAACVKDALI